LHHRGRAAGADSAAAGQGPVARLRLALATAGACSIMSGKTHTYTCTLSWTGNTGRGTADYKAYARDHAFTSPGKPDLPGSADPAFRGDKSRYNPEELLVASLSS